MSRLTIRFVSSNPSKLQEASSILVNAGVEVIPLKIKIDELQTEDTTRLVKDKMLKAFAQVGRPLFVEHTGLYLEQLNGLPGGLTQLFWDKLEAERFAELFGNTSNASVIAKTLIGYTDSRSFHMFAGEVAGKIAPSPRGHRDFQWDCVFVPDGFPKTFAEIGEQKNQISMRRIALDRFADFLRKRGHS